MQDDLLNADEISAKLIELEDRSRRNNLQIDGIKEEIQNTLADKLEIKSDVEIDRCHKIGPRKTKAGQNRD